MQLMTFLSILFKFQYCFFILDKNTIKMPCLLGSLFSILFFFWQLLLAYVFFLSIKALSGFEYVEPNGKDVGVNVRKKAETISALLNDKEKIQAVREKAAATRDK